MSRVPLRRAAPAAFRCPACEAALRVKEAASGRAFDCPECGAGLLVRPDGEGGVTVRTVGEPADRSAPRWPFALAAVGVGCAVAAGWIVLRSGAERAPEAVKIADEKPAPAPVVVEPAPVVPAVAEPPEPVESPAEPRADAAPAPPVAEVVPDEPVRPAVTAPRPRGDIAVRRVERRLGAELAGYSLPRPVPLREAIADLEDLLRLPIAVEANGDQPVRADLIGPLTVREVLEALARRAGLRVAVDAGGVRLEPDRLAP